MGNIRLYGSTSGYTELAPPAVAPDGVLSLPTGTGTLATQASVGLVKIVDQSFTTASTVSVNNCFTSAYENYLVLASGTGSADVSIRMRVRASGSDLTNSVYRTTRLTVSTGSPAGYTALESAIYIGQISGSPKSFYIASEFSNPNTAQNTGVIVNNTNDTYLLLNAMMIQNTTLYDGLTIYPDSGTITGTLRVYGYRN